MEPSLVSNDFQRDMSMILVVNYFDYLAKAAFSDNLDDFVSVSDVITLYKNVVIPVIVESVVFCIGNCWLQFSAF